MKTVRRSPTHDTRNILADLAKLGLNAIGSVTRVQASLRPGPRSSRPSRLRGSTGLPVAREHLQTHNHGRGRGLRESGVASSPGPAATLKLGPLPALTARYSLPKYLSIYLLLPSSTLIVDMHEESSTNAPLPPAHGV
eukprot:758236-Hanusia_phi.AAC.1